ncbi:DEAD/DEAH box helicase [Rhodococcus spelaei]|uniref:DEAD/DEAH box helicase n=1 Tax=Rhodococcus spelaei TaxID=2546320 RepID=A0A541BQH3_9NOCA|nr:DEAD/DEAH box helicase family protein [Rhodococcus spelaei]TQF74581.1 DEAD/DEAH box helicase [Rhodococcus spelaei]
MVTKSRRRKTRSVAKAAAPVAAAGERIWVLDVPFRAPAPGAHYNGAIKAHVYVGDSLPDELTRYAAKPYSYQQWTEDELNGTRGPSATAAAKRLRPEQVEGAAAIVAAAAAGSRGFCLSDDPGLGKTLTAVAAAKEVAEQRGGSAILVTVDRPTSITIPHWRASIAAVGDGGFRWLIISPDQLKKLIARNGRPKFRFDVVINDEAHLFRHDSQRTDYQRRVVRHLDPPDKAPFVISMTATLGHHPGEWRYLSSLLAQVHDEPPGRWDDLGARLSESGVPLERRLGRWQWTAEAKSSARSQADAVARVREWMTSADPAVMMHRSAPWGQAPIDGLGVDLSVAEREQYEMDWGEYRREMRIARTGSDGARGRAALIRFRQKAGMIRAPHTAALVAATAERGYQCLVATEMVSTGAEPVADLLEERGISVSRIFGGRRDAENERLRFQRGDSQVVVFNTTSAISLHAAEHLADGSHATDTPRLGFFHQPRYSGIAARQTIGRAHRDYQVCPWSLLYAVDTVEEQAAVTMVDRLMVLSAGVDGDLGALAAIARLFDADWLGEQAFD